MSLDKHDSDLKIMVDGEEAFKTAKDFFRILSPHNLKKIKHYRNINFYKNHNLFF